MGRRGWWTVARWKGTPLRLHWSLPLSAVVLGGMRFDPAAWLGLVLVVLAHELGHAALVHRYRLPVVAVDLHGMGGECRYEGHPTRWQVAVIAWGGVLAQLALLPLGLWLAPRMAPSFASGVLASFGRPSLWMLLFNLLPIPPLDGAEAWRLPGLWRAARRRRAARRAPLTTTRRAEAAVAELERREREAKLDGALPAEIAEQLARAVKRAYDEREPRK